MKPSTVLGLDLDQLSRSMIGAIDDMSHLPSIAILPFADLDEESREKHSGRWLADDVIHHLCRFRYLSVVGRHASDAACRKHHLLKAIAQTLGTRYLATGSVRWTPLGLTIQIQLIDSASGQQLWCSSYQRERMRASDLEDDLAKEVATGLAVSIDARERERLERQNKAHDEQQGAVSLALMAEQLTREFQQKANERARRLAEKACRIDPMSARAHAVLSRTHHLDVRYAWTKDADKSIEQAIELAEVAIELDPMESAGHAEVGMNKLYSRDYAASRAAYRRALDINPNEPDILAEFSLFLINDGSPEDAIESLAMTIHLRPERAGMYRYYLACAFDSLGDDDMVISLLSIAGDNREGHRLMAASYARLGMPEDAARQADLAMKAHPNFSLAHWRTVIPHRDPQFCDRIIEGMARGGLR